MASAKLGADMSHVICTREAGAVIKTYSPNLMVHPFLQECADPDMPDSAVDDTARTIATQVRKALFSRLHALVIGPGLGRDRLMQSTAVELILAAKQDALPIVLDADALAVKDVVYDYPHCVLTPNVVEFRRLERARESVFNEKPEGEEPGEACRRLAGAFNGAVILMKGEIDYIAAAVGQEKGKEGERETRLASCELPGGLKRCGGQGDTLTGAIGTFLCWRKAFHDGLWDVQGEKMSGEESLRVAAWAGAAVARTASRRAFEKKGRSVQASDLTEEVHGAFLEIWGDDPEREGRRERP
ncbi:MAG: hypothetical protein M1814_005730 [Vezdaea aestivalis]|nr:MAG: hypothetical protein M1814_005730 [Vezdaea aestivalis]